MGAGTVRLSLTIPARPAAPPPRHAPVSLYQCLKIIDISKQCEYILSLFPTIGIRENFEESGLIIRLIRSE